jgi:hypothetical protein
VGPPDTHVPAAPTYARIKKKPHPINPPRASFSKPSNKSFASSSPPPAPRPSPAQTLAGAAAAQIPGASVRRRLASSRMDAEGPRLGTDPVGSGAPPPPKVDGPCISFLILASRPGDNVLTSSWFLGVQELEGTGYSSGVGAAEGTASRQLVDGLGGGLLHFLIFFCALVLIRAGHMPLTRDEPGQVESAFRSPWFLIPT